ICQQGLQFFPDRLAALRAVRTVLAAGGRLAVSTWAAPAPESVWEALADAFARHLGRDAGARMRAPFGLADLDELGTLVRSAGLASVAAFRHTRTVRFARRDLAARIALASPVSAEFAAAPAERRSRIVADVTARLRACGDADDVWHPMTTNVALAA